MKKILFLMLGAVVALTSCHKDEFSSLGDGREIEVSIAAALPSTMTRSSEQGGIDNVDWSKYSLRYTLEIYDGETVLPVSKEEGAATRRVIYKDKKADAKTADFETIRLLSGKEYRFVLWADFVSRTGNEGNYTYTEKYYKTTNAEGLKKVEKIWNPLGALNPIVCDDARDAYFAFEKITLTESTAKTISLKRPLGKLRIITTDIADLMGTTITENTPVAIKIPGGIYSYINAFDGTTPDPGYGVMADYTTTVKELTQTKGTLFFEYFIVPPTTMQFPVQVPVKFEIECLGAKFEMKTDAVKLERNKLTTVTGKLLTSNANISVEIKDEFSDPGIIHEVPVQEPTPAAAQSKLDAIDFLAEQRPPAPISVSITQPVATETSNAAVLSIPAAVAVANTPQIQVDLAAGIAENNTFTLKQAVASEDQAPAYTGKVFVTAPASTAGSLVIDMPSATVYVNGEIKQLTSTVSKNTLIVEKGAKITTLTLDEGNTIIYGSVTNLNFTQALFNKKCVLPDGWSCHLLESMRTVKVYADIPLNIVNSNIEGIKADSIPAAVYFNYIDITDGVIFYPGFWGSKQQMKTPWYGEGAMPDEVNWPVSVQTETTKRSSFTTPITANRARNTTKATTITTDFPINQPMTFSRDFSFTGAGRFVLNADLVLNGSTLDAATNIGIAPITINAGNVTFTGNNLTLNQTTSGNGDGTSKSGLGIVVNESGSINNVKIKLTDSHLNLNGPTGYQRAIVFPTSTAQTGMEVTLLRTNITCLTTPSMPNATYSQGIGVGALTNPKITLTDCTLAGMYYGVNNPSAGPTNMELTINNSRLSAYGALNLRGSSTIKIENGSVLTGRNFYPVGTNDFAAIVYNTNEINAASTLLIDGSTIQNEVENTAKEYMIDVRGNTNVEITVKNHSTLSDKAKPDEIKLDYLVDNLGEGSTINADETTILTGKPGVTLTKQ